MCSVRPAFIAKPGRIRAPVRCRKSRSSRSETGCGTPGTAARDIDGDAGQRLVHRQQAVGVARRPRLSPSACSRPGRARCRRPRRCGGRRCADRPWPKSPCRSANGARAGPAYGRRSRRRSRSAGPSRRGRRRPRSRSRWSCGKRAFAHGLPFGRLSLGGVIASPAPLGHPEALYRVAKSLTTCSSRIVRRARTSSGFPDVARRERRADLAALLLLRLTREIAPDRVDGEVDLRFWQLCGRRGRQTCSGGRLIIRPRRAAVEESDSAPLVVGELAKEHPKTRLAVQLFGWCNPRTR